jgi:isochorismate synthase EntC
MFEIINNVIQQTDIIMYRLNGGSTNVPFQNSEIKNMSKCTPEVVTDVLEEPNFLRNNHMDMKIVVSDDDEDEEDEDEDEEEEEEDEEDEDEDDDEEDDEDEKVKIITVEVLDKINAENLNEDEFPDSSVDLEESSEPLFEMQVLDDSTMMQVEKVEQDNPPTYEIEDNKDNLKDVYNKMTVQDLKKMVITKGLCSDVSKLKKNDLLKLLENSD